MGFVDVHVKFQTFILVELVGYGMDVLEIWLKNSAFVRFTNLQHPISTCGFLVSVSIDPNKFGSEKMVFNCLMVGIKLKNNFIGLYAGDKVGEVRIFNRRQGVEVISYFVIQLIILQAFVKFRDFEYLINMKAIF